jgi:signal transduction histidine kinase/ActR/RegA family two-component response regulator
MTNPGIVTRPSVLAELDAVSRTVATPLLLLRADAPDFQILDANEALLAVAGVSRADLIGCGYFERFFPDPAHHDEVTAATGRSMRESFERVLLTRTPDVMPVQRYDLARRDGSPEERYWRPTNTPIFESNGRLSRLAHQVQDVTSVVMLTRATEAAEARARAEGRLRQVFEQAPVAYAVLRGPAHHFETANPRFLDMIGSRPLIGRPIREALPELSRDGFFELVDWVFLTGQAQHAHEYHVRLDRTNAPAEGVFTFVLEPLRDAADAIEGVAVMGIEVTEHVRIREAAEWLAAEQDAQRRQIQTVLEQTPVGVAIGDAATGRLVFVNRKVHEIFGRDAGAESRVDYGAHHPAFHLDGRRLTPDEWPMARVLTQGEVIEGEVMEIDRDAGRRTIRVNAAPVRNADDHIIAGVVILQDITGERRVEQRLHDAQRLQSVGTLAGGVAHEVNNALQITLGFGTFVLQAIGPEHPHAPDMRVALQAAQRAARVAQQLLTFARRHVTQARALDLYELTLDLKPVLQQLLGVDKLLTLESASARPVIHADASQVQQVLINLVANAGDASETGTEVRIRIDEITIEDQTVTAEGIAVSPGPYGRLTVVDQGSGMDAKTLARVFEPFFTTKALGEGTGLGLSMVYGILKQHGGYVWVRSEAGVGTTIELQWPLEAAAVAPASVDAGAVEPLGIPGRQPHRVVLIAEDEPLVRMLAMRSLEREGYQVVGAEDGRAALDMLDSGAVHPDVLITDVVMPRLNGRQLSDAVEERWPGLPVLFISGHLGSDTVVQRLVPAGAPFLQKPFAPETLTRMVDELIAQTAGRR